MAKKVNIQELARRYTTSIFDLAKSEKKLERISTDLDALEALSQDPKMKKLLGTKTLSGAKQTELVRGFGKTFDPLTINFLLVIARNGRMEYLNEIINAFRNKIAEEKGEIKAEITSAVKLDGAQLAAIAKDLSAKSGKTVKLQENIKPEIIGGLVIKIGAKMFDYSVKSRLTRLKNKLKESA